MPYSKLLLLWPAGFEFVLEFRPRHRVKRNVIAAFFGVSRLFLCNFGTNVVELESRVKISLLNPTIIRLEVKVKQEEKKETRGEKEREKKERGNET